MKNRIFIVLIFIGCFSSSSTFANWTLNLGYHNPMNARLGLNLLYWGSQWNFEVGVGWFDADLKATDDKNEVNRNDDDLSVAAAGDIDLKYRFATGTVAPYVQVGLGATTGASVGDNNNLGADIGGPFIGIGLMFGKPNFYGYLAYNLTSSEDDGQVQAGIGLDI